MQIPKTLAAMLATGQMSDVDWQKHDAAVAAKREAEERERLAAEQRDWLRARPGVLRAGGVPARKLEKAIEASYDESNAAWQAVADLRSGGEVAIRVLAGSVGCGKTTAAVRWLHAHGGARPVFCKAAAFVAAGRFDREFRARWEVATALMLDDLGAEYADAKESFIADLDELIDFYAESRSVLVVTTNLRPDAFKARYGARIESRLRESPECWRNVKGPDLRGAR